MEYPSIVRDTIDFISDTEVCNIGYNEGNLTDGRPYRMEVWESYGVTNTTIFISILGLEVKNEDEIKDLLVKEGLIEIIKDDIYITEVEDIEENTFLSINMPTNDQTGELNKYLVELKDFII